jgi:hypothetical protein
LESSLPEAPEPDPPSPEALESAFTNLVHWRLEAFARQRGYDSMDTARLAALSAEYSDDGRIANAAYDQTWTAALALIPDVREGTITPQEALARLPEIKW